MPWVKLDDQIMRNPKVRGISRDAFALHVAGLCYCATALTDGRIPDRDLPLVAAEALAPESSASDLEKADLWERTDDGWMIHDYLDYQPSRADVMDDRRKARERKQRQRSKDRPPDGHAGSHAVTGPVTDSGRHAGSHEPPSRPVPSPDIPPVVSESDRHPTGPPVDNDDDQQLKQDTWAQIASWKAADAGKTGNPRWVATTRANQPNDAHPDGDTYDTQADRMLATFAIDDPKTLAEVLTGRRAKTYLPRRPTGDTAA